MSREGANVETVRAQLAEAEAAIAPIKMRLAPVSLAAALSGDYTEANVIAVELATALVRRDLLQAALAQAEAIEAQRVADARSAEELRLAAALAKERVARVRAPRQHISALRHAARAYQESIAAEDIAFKAMLAAAASARAILITGTTDEEWDKFHDGVEQEAPVALVHWRLEENRLYDLCGVERARIGGRDPHKLPEARYHHSSSFYNLTDEPLMKQLGAIVDDAGDALAVALDVAPAEPVTALPVPTLDSTEAINQEHATC